MMASLAPAMRRGNTAARNAHFAMAFAVTGGLVWQLQSGFEMHDMAVIFARTSSSIARWVRPSSFLSFSQTAHKDDDTQTTKKPPKPNVQFVALANVDKNISFIKLEDAMKIAERRRLRLLKVKDFDKKHQCPLYTLQSDADIMREEIKDRRKKESGVKGPKLLSISSRISQNDLHFKTQRVLAWVSKGHEVRVTIKGNDGGSKEDAYSQMEGILKDKCRILQTRTSGHDIKFQVIQLKSQPTSGE